jgi:hypothetical protein
MTWRELGVATALAIVVGVILDLLRVGSRIREGWRWVKDKYAEGSIAAINQRIGEQEKYRNTLRTYLASDKTFYLAMLRSIVGILLFMCAAGLVLILGRLKVMIYPLSEAIALAIFIIAIAAGISTMQFGSFDASKISEPIRKVDAEILALEEARRNLQESHNIVN